MMPPNPTPGPPPVVTTQPPTPPLHAQNPWVMRPAAPETGALYVEYVSTRAMGMRGEFAGGKFSFVFSVALWTFFLSGFLMRYADGRIAVGIGLSLLASLMLNAALIAVLFLARYPTAATTRRLSYTLLRTGLHGRNPQGTTFKSWKELRSVKRVGDDLIFDYGLTVTAYMPVEAFGDAASAERYMQAVRDMKAANGDFSVISPELLAEFATPSPAPA